MGEPAEGPRVRDAGPQDAARCAAIYAHYVEDTIATFETDPPPPEELARRIAAAQRQHAWLVAEQAGELLGYAHAGPFRTRAAYDWSCETTVYLRAGLRRTGTGRLLVETLLRRLVERGLQRAYAVIALPNEASLGLHGALGYRRVAHLERVGYKAGAWRDVVWLQRDLGDADPPPPLR